MNIITIITIINVCIYFFGDPLWPYTDDDDDDDAPFGASWFLPRQAQKILQKRKGGVDNWIQCFWCGYNASGVDGGHVVNACLFSCTAEFAVLSSELLSCIIHLGLYPGLIWPACLHVRRATAGLPVLQVCADFSTDIVRPSLELQHVGIGMQCGVQVGRGISM